MDSHAVIELAGLAATVVAVAGVVLNNRRRSECFWLWLASNAVSLAVHAAVGVWSLALRDFVFFLLALEGLWLWRRR